MLQEEETQSFKQFIEYPFSLINVHTEHQLDCRNCKIVFLFLLPIKQTVKVPFSFM